jgi:hypothetical protein
MFVIQKEEKGIGLLIKGLTCSTAHEVHVLPYSLTSLINEQHRYIGMTQDLLPEN